MKGFILQNKSGGFLTKHGWWYEHGKPSDAFVFNLHCLADIADGEWANPPVWAIPAEYTDGVRVLGEPIDITWIFEDANK